MRWGIGSPETRLEWLRMQIAERERKEEKEKRKNSGLTWWVCVPEDLFLLWCVFLLFFSFLSFVFCLFSSVLSIINHAPVVTCNFPISSGEKKAQTKNPASFQPTWWRGSPKQKTLLLAMWRELAMYPVFFLSTLFRPLVLWVFPKRVFR